MLEVNASDLETFWVLLRSMGTNEELGRQIELAQVYEVEKIDDPLTAKTSMLEVNASDCEIFLTLLSSMGTNEEFGKVVGLAELYEVEKIDDLLTAERRKVKPLRGVSNQTAQ